MTQRDQEHILKAAKESGHAASMMIHAVENTKGRTKQRKIITHSFIYLFIHLFTFLFNFASLIFLLQQRIVLFLFFFENCINHLRRSICLFYRFRNLLNWILF